MALPVDYERFFLDHLGLIHQVVRFIARRHLLTPDEMEELASSVNLKLVDHDYAVLRKFEGRCSVRTYLTSVVQRHFLDSRDASWGKWRPSAEARRLGPVAILLDRMLTRDRLPFDEALETLRTNHGITMSREQLHALVNRLPRRARRQFVGEEQLAEVPALSRPSAAAADADSLADADRIEGALEAVLGQLPTDDRLILKMLFQDDVQISRIARVLGVNQRSLYSRIDRVKKSLRADLEKRGVSRELVLDIIGHPAVDLNVVIAAEPPENPPLRPSIP